MLDLSTRPGTTITCVSLPKSNVSAVLRFITEGTPLRIGNDYVLASWCNCYAGKLIKLTGVLGCHHRRHFRVKLKPDADVFTDLLADLDLDDEIVAPTKELETIK